MSMKAELEHLTHECEVCALSDEGSIDEHLESCQPCQERAKKAEEISQLIESMQVLASKPEEERRMVLATRFASFASMPDEKRRTAISDMLDSLEDLNDTQRNVIIKTRTDILTSIPKTEREALMGTMRDVMQGWSSERKLIEERSIKAATEDYMVLKRTMVRRMFMEILK